MRSKRFKKLPTDTSKLKANDFENVLKEVKKNCTTKFDESIDLNMQINHKQKKSEINLRTIVNLPSGSGKKIKVAVVCEDGKVQEAKNAGADIAGGDDFIDKIKNGELSFDKLLCTPSMMIKLSKLGKILGPKGLMPNPKLGTVSNDIKKSVQDIKTGLLEIKNDKDGNLGATIGRKSFSEENLIKNFNHFIESIKKEKPENLKGEFIKNKFITSTMGISYKVNSKV